jgi:hypothetical protein
VAEQEQWHISAGCGVDLDSGSTGIGEQYITIKKSSTSSGLFLDRLLKLDTLEVLE